MDLIAVLDQGIFIALLNPAISLVLAAAFFLFWLVLRARLYLVSLAAGYAMSACGFLLQRFELPLGFDATKLLSNLCFGAAACLVAAAICQRYGRKVPYGALGLLVGSGMAAFTWFLLVDPNLTWRIYAMNFALGGVCLLIAVELRAVRDKILVDRILYAAAILAGLNFFARTIAVIYAYGAFDTYDGFYASAYWASLLLSHALISLSIALCLIVAAGMDVLKELRTESQTDPLSGLLNRRGLEEKLVGLGAKTGVADSRYSLLMADLDRFKLVNDRYGHPVGDAVIAAFAKLLQKTGSAKTIVARTGGEEFAVLFPGGDLADASFFAESIRAMLAREGFTGPASIVGHITCSFGVAERCEREDLATVLKRADDALLHAKKDGRNRVRVAYARPGTAAMHSAAA